MSTIAEAGVDCKTVEQIDDRDQFQGNGVRVFVFEYITGGGCIGSDIIASLAAEGDMMLCAMVRDLVELADVQVLITRDARLDELDIPVDVCWVHDDWASVWRACVDVSDAILPIAPETGGILEALSRQICDSDRRLLNSRPDAVAITASKLSTINHLGELGLPVVPCWRADRIPPLEDQPLVVKPDQGAGCIDVHLLNRRSDLEAFLMQKKDLSQWVVQPYLKGIAASLSLLVAADQVCLLGCNLQRIVQMDDQFSFLGCLVNGIERDFKPLMDLGQGIGSAIPGLWGYVGVDLVITENGPVVLEVNPRLTTSYVGLTRSVGANVAEFLLQLDDKAHALPQTLTTGNCVHVEVESSCVA